VRVDRGGGWSSAWWLLAAVRTTDTTQEAYPTSTNYR
jgi:hypothetical protein